MMKIIPRNDNVLVKRDKPEEKLSPGGIHIPKTNQPAPVFCTVIAVGDMLDHSMAEIFPGERVVVSLYAGVNINTDDDEFIMVKDEDIIAVAEDEPVKKVVKKKVAKKKVAK